MLSTTAIIALASIDTAEAQTSPTETIIVNGERTQEAATNVAPTSAPLDSIQPTSIISQDFIEKNVPLSANYDEAIKFAPSVFDTAPNGPGLAESQNISIRGFQDGQFNVTFDGIPIGDSNDFTHHTTSFFGSNVFGQISVDRGPGTAATIGNATFGGTVSILSKAPEDEMSIRPYFSYGSFNTQIYGGELNSGAIDKYNSTRVFLDAEGLSSDGYLTNEGQDRQNVFLKIVQPVGTSTTVTVAGLYNSVKQHISLGSTLAQIRQFGPNFGLSTDPTKQNFTGYNLDRIHTDFEYVDVQSRLGDGWSIDSKAYSYAYYHQGLNGEDPNGEFPNGTSLGANDVPGQLLQNDYRSLGTITRLTREFSFGELKTGVWYDHQINSRALTEVDFTQAQAPNLNPNTGANNGIDRELHQTLTTIQPYVQFDWRPIDGLTVSPGLRYSYFDRSVNADVNVKTGAAQRYDNSFDAVLPSLSVNYLFTPEWSGYFQVAQGALAPNENFFNTVTPSSTSLSPQTSTNYQIGSVLKTKNWAVSGDLYYIDFSNLIGSRTVGGQAEFFNQGGVTYKGIEAEVTRTIGYGVSVYGNGSLNSATSQTTHLSIANAPAETAALGVIYDANGFYGSLLGKWIGTRYGSADAQQGLDPFYTIDLSLGYDLGYLSDRLSNTKIKLQVDNITDVTKVVNLAGFTVQNGTPLYWTQPGRSAFVTLTTSF